MTAISAFRTGFKGILRPAEPGKWQLACLLWLAAALPAFTQPVITTQPTNQSVIQGGTASFTVVATGAAPLSYQWRWLTNGVISDISGATNSILTLTNVRLAAQLVVIVSNSAGVRLSSTRQLYVLVPPVMTAPLASQTIELGLPCNIVAKVAANSAPGFEPPAYQWQFNGQPLPGITSNTVSIASFQAENVGAYSAIITNAAGSVTTRVASVYLAIPQLTRITSGPIATELGGNNRACAWGDYDNDGDPDLFVVDFTGTYTNRLYRNDGGGVFTPMTADDVGSILTDRAAWTGACWGDFDNDGALDVYVSSTEMPTCTPTNGFYRNNGQGAFVLVTNAGDLATNIVLAENVACADYDTDGFLDLCFSGGNSLFHSEGNSQFTRHDLPLPVGSYFATWFDSDGDGDPELLLIGNESVPANYFFRNDNEGDFFRVTSVPFAGDTARVPAPADYDNDGLIDLCVGQHLYRNLGGNQWSNSLPGSFHTGALAPAWGDYDNDGDLDLFVGGHYFTQDIFLANNGDGTFSPLPQLASSFNVPPRVCSAAAAWADYDNDGFLDLYVAQFGLFGGYYTGLLFHNEGNSNHWFMAKFTGTVANRSAIGAKVRTLATIFGRTYWQMREISCGGVGQNDLRVHFGLGDATNITTLRIEWPSGQATELHDVAANQILAVTEPPGLAAVAAANGEFSLQLRAHVGMTSDLFVSSNLVDWLPWDSLTQTSRVMRISDPGASVSSHRFFKAAAR